MKNQPIRFHKLHGAGNDFVIIDNRSDGKHARFDGKNAALIRRICDRHFGVGADGLMLISEDTDSDFQLEYYNADGFPGEMCGNGARCAVWLAHLLGVTGRQCKFIVWGENYEAEVLENQQVRLKMNPPSFSAERQNLQSLCDNRFPEMGWLNTGVPHLVVKSAENLAALDVRKFGAYFRYHPKFEPEGVNVNFVVPESEHQLNVRVYERGVENETLACGTGAVACAIYAAQQWQWQSPVRVNAVGGVLQIAFDPDFQQIYLTGPVATVFEGELNELYFQNNAVVNQ